MEEADGAEDGGEGGGFGGSGEAGVADQGRKQTLDVVLGGCESVEDLNKIKRDAEQGVLRVSEIGDMKAASGAEDAEDLGEGAKLLIAREVMKEEAGEDVIERSIGKGNRFRHDLVEVDLESGARGLITGDAQDLGIGVDGGHAGCGMLRLEKQCQRAGAAAEIEDAVFRLERGLLEEFRFKRSLANGRLDDEVVPRGERAKAESGDVSGWHAC